MSRPYTINLPGLMVGGWTLVRPVSEGRWAARCGSCWRELVRAIDALRANARTGRSRRCWDCHARRRPRLCGGCGTTDPARFGLGKATECMACARWRQRHRRGTDRAR